MDWESILTIIFAVLSIVSAFLSYYMNVRKKIAESITQEVNNAEVDGAIGEEKKVEVIAQLRKIIPAVLKPFITDNILDALVQKAFDNIEAYAKKQLKKGKRKNEKG